MYCFNYVVFLWKKEKKKIADEIVHILDDTFRRVLLLNSSLKLISLRFNNRYIIIFVILYHTSIHAVCELFFFWFLFDTFLEFRPQNPVIA